jgi:hypothetical protein
MQTSAYAIKAYLSILLPNTHPQVRDPTPIGSFISIWYGEDGDDDEVVASDKKIKRDVEARTPIGSFISIWYGEDGDDDEAASADAKKRSVSVKKRAPDFKVKLCRSFESLFVADKYRRRLALLSAHSSPSGTAKTVTMKLPQVP